MYRKPSPKWAAHHWLTCRFGSSGLPTAGTALGFALLTASAPAWGATVDIQCPRLVDPARGELEARARLFLTSADMESATIGLECDATNAWLVWTDGGKTLIDPRTNLVEGTLDAIEDRIARAKRAAPRAPGATGPEGAGGPAGGPEDTSLPAKPPTSADTPPEEPSLRAPEVPAERSGIDLEGGVGLALLTEFWSGSYTGGVGPRLDVGVGLGRKLSIVISEGARFAVGEGSGQMMAFDLQVGVAYGAPYQIRTGFGVMALFGAERLAATRTSISGTGGLWTWAATASLGARASIATGPLDAWFGVDGMLRSDTIETGGPKSTSVPTLSAILSIGCFLPAFAGGPTNEPRVQGSPASANKVTAQ
jgi:hypothetical protein